MAAWKTDDKEWMKARKAAWKSIKPKIDSINNLYKEERKVLKDYFLNGIIDPNWPIKDMVPGLLLEFWLHPGHSDEHWRSLLPKYNFRDWSDSSNAFKDANRGIEHYCPNSESFFDGLEERLCHYFHFDRTKKEDWPECDNDQFLLLAQDRLLMAQSFASYFHNPNPHPYDITQFKVKAWRDAMCLAYDPDLPIFTKIPALQRVVQGVEKVLSNTDDYPERVVKLAEELTEVFDDPELPDSAKEDIASIRAGTFKKKKPPRKSLP